jgi:hypothetical protein|tara:strand:+ start:324 stop:587 length:264 start_codon:yes stop_codon:yes gene_type:complete
MKITPTTYTIGSYIYNMNIISYIYIVYIKNGEREKHEGKNTSQLEENLIRIRHRHMAYADGASIDPLIVSMAIARNHQSSDAHASYK